MPRIKILEQLTDGSISKSMPDPPPTISASAISAVALVVEEDAMIRHMAILMLETLGYRVLAVKNPKAALDSCSGIESPVDLVMMDVIMAGMNGRELEILL